MHGTHVCREAVHAGRLFVPERRYASQPRRGQVARQRPVDQGQGESDEVLQLQKAAGNRAVSETIGARQAAPPAQRLMDAGGATVQRASFAELMAFWKKQELGQDPAKEEAKGEESPNVPPDPEFLPEEVKAMNPAVEEEAGEQQQQPRGPVAYQVDGGGSITQGGEPFDTSKMYSKFMGDGFGIYVMGKDGTFYATSHKIGLFHHSSFLGGGDVAGAGEMKVVGGTLQFITNKSGHYWPGDQELAQTLNELQGASGFAAAGLAQLMPNGGLRNPYPGGPAQFLQDHPVGVLNNKDGTKYGGKAMVMDKSEKENSIATVRAILASYVKQAQLGKLKKFNKPNPNFGNTLEDIKQLVLAEFGWNDQDVADYEEVLKNWNNDKEIVDVREAPPPPIPLSNSLSSDESSPTSQSVDSGEKSASGRDWEAELEEALQDNPSPDWQGLGVEPYGSGLIIWNEEHTSFRTATAKQKVQLLKGEVTIDELR